MPAGFLGGEGVIIERKGAQPNKHTFLMKPIYDFIMRYYSKNKRWIDPFCGFYSPVQDDYRNDLNPDIPAKYHLEANDFLKLWETESIDGIILDPPYSNRQLKECYTFLGIKKIPYEMSKMFPYSYNVFEINRILKPGGVLLKFGWNSNRLSRLFKIIHVLVVNHGGRHTDTICTAQIKIQQRLDRFL